MVEESKLARVRSIQIVFGIGIFLLLLKAFSLQVWDSNMRSIAGSVGTVQLTEYPSRGVMLDRHGKYLTVNQPVYQLDLLYREFEQSAAKFDTLKFCNLLNITPDYFEQATTKPWGRRFSKVKPFVFLNNIPPSQYAAFQESLHEFPGFLPRLRSTRIYPTAHGAHLLGYLGEISPEQLDSNNVYYTSGDYLGVSGLERQYETYLRGKKGIRTVHRDNRGREVGQVQDASLQVDPESGYDLLTTIDLDLQAYAETLMVNKIGSIIAIEPSTGEVLAMVSAPSYNPNMLIAGPNRGNNYVSILQDSLRPFLNRSVNGKYPPGSPFKTLVSLIGLQDGTLTPGRGVPCRGAFYSGGTKLTGCHNHPSCQSVEDAIAQSCNTYFVTAFLEYLNQGPNNESPDDELDRFNEYLYAFGLGRPLGIDYPFELSGFVPDGDYYNKVFTRESFWRAIWLRSLGIGQGEYELTTLQLANLAAAIANRGYWITPHLVKGMRLGDTSNVFEPPPLDLQKHLTGIDAQNFVPVVNGMERVFINGTARASAVPGITMCGKTGTAENSQRGGKDHSIFFAFAPKDNPRIAIAVYIENAGFGGTYAAPTASLLMEKFLTDTISVGRQWTEKRIKEANLLPGK